MQIPQSTYSYCLKHIILFSIVILLCCFCINISTGSISLKTLLHNPQTLEAILIQYRLPKAICCILTGIALSCSGMVLQTYFTNPIAGPYVLGINSGASLGVALLILGKWAFPSISTIPFMYEIGSVGMACIGSCGLLAIVLILSQWTTQSTHLLLTGLLLGYVASGIISVLSFIAPAQALQQFVFWGMGNLSRNSWQDIGIYSSCIVLGLGCIGTQIRNLDALLLGTQYAQTLGIELSKTRNILLIGTGILTGSCTAFVGTVGFVGLLIPYWTRLVISNPRHGITLPICMLWSGSFMLLCDSIAQCLITDVYLPINTITTFFGIPVILKMLWKAR